MTKSFSKVLGTVGLFAGIFLAFKTLLQPSYAIKFFIAGSVYSAILILNKTIWQDIGKPQVLEFVKSLLSFILEFFQKKGIQNNG